MSKESNLVLKEKKGGFWKFLGILLAIAGACVVIAAVYKKFFQKDDEDVIEGEGEEPEALDAPDAAPATEDEAKEASDTGAEDAAIEVPADAVIANAEED